MIKKKIQKLSGLKKKNQGQSLAEYAVLIAVVASALIAMQVYVRRGVEANLKMMEERINASPQ